MRWEILGTTGAQVFTMGEHQFIVRPAGRGDDTWDWQWLYEGENVVGGRGGDGGCYNARLKVTPIIQLLESLSK